MKAVGDAALGIPWIAPCASSLVSLTRDGSAAWEKLRVDPGAVLLAARAAGNDTSFSIAAILDGARILEQLQRHLSSSVGWVDWASIDVAPLYQSSLRQAALAYSLAKASGSCDRDKAWIGGMLASLGWFALSTVEPQRPCSGLCTRMDHSSEKALRAATLARRLSREWGLPDWLRSLVGHLSLNGNLSRRFGADVTLFQIVQFAVAIVQEEEKQCLHPNLPDRATLQRAAGVSNETLEQARREAQILASGLHLENRKWQRPGEMALLPEFVELALQMRRREEKELIERLHGDLELLQLALEEQQVQERERLQGLKLSALAELAAGAGHEINNPLAVISGQAQYALKQIHQAEDELVEDATALAVLHELRAKVDRSLHTVVGQAHRIHHILTDLMQFARPANPKRQTVRLHDLLRDAVHAVQALADNRRARLSMVEPPENWQVYVDPMQICTALTGLLRNAIEAVAAEGWVGIRAEARGDSVAILIEDNGQGPTPLALEHMFDPFFSGRSAGRGRGLGLPTAWRLAKQHGGEIRYEGIEQGKTRFAMILPDLDKTVSANGSTLFAEPARNGLNGDH